MHACYPEEDLLISKISKPPIAKIILKINLPWKVIVMSCLDLAIHTNPFQFAPDIPNSESNHHHHYQTTAPQLVKSFPAYTFRSFNMLRISSGVGGYAWLIMLAMY